MVEKMSALGQTSRASSALLKRQEAIKRWKSSDTNRENAHRSPNRITFDNETVFLYVVSSGDVDETRNLINGGVDINCSNVDGLTGLHQACIDENAEMVELLCNSGAFLDVRDDEGWTPLHAAASAGNVQIAQILIDNNADLLAVNNEGEIPVDLAEEEEMEEFLEDEMEKLGVELDEVRNKEEKMMMEDAMSWLNSKKIDETYNFQGASALHVAASKGYEKVMKLLIQAGCDVNLKDKDGWSPLHAAVHWAQQQAAEILTEAGADFSVRNSIGQTPVEVAQGDMIKFVEELRKKSKVRGKDGMDRSNRIIDQRSKLNRNDINDNDQIGSVPPYDLNKKPVKSALKGGRAKHLMGNSVTEDGEASESESEEDTEESESDTENQPQPTAKPTITGPLRPSLTRPSTTASNEKVSTQRNPLIANMPLRPSSVLNKDNDNKEDSKYESVSARINSRMRNRDDENKRDVGPSRFKIPLPGKTEDKDSAISVAIPRPSRRTETEGSKNDDWRSKIDIPRPVRNLNKDENKNEDSKPEGNSRYQRSHEKEDDSKSKEDMRRKLGLMKPGESASAAIDRYHKRKAQQEELAKLDKDSSDEKRYTSSRTDDVISSIRKPKTPLTAPLRPVRSTEDRNETDVRTSIRSRPEHDKGDSRQETISIRKRLTDREKETEKKDDEEEDDDENIAAQKARRKRKSREQRKATGVAYMPVEDEDEDEEKKETKYNTKVNEENEKKSNPLASDDEPPRLSLAERLRRSRENREGTSSSSAVSSSLGNRSRDITSSSISSKSTSSDSSDARELQRRLKEALNEVDEYKAKLEKANKEKEELREKLTQCEEAMKTMKDENGALIRVISTLTRSNSS